MVVQKMYNWQLELFKNSNDPDGWFIDGTYCSNCRFSLSSFKYYHPGHPVNYCPGCGGYIDGIKNPYPPIKE